MSDEPYIPFYKPYGMTDEEYQHEVRLAQVRHDEWEAEQEYINNLNQDAINRTKQTRTDQSSKTATLPD